MKRLLILIACWIVAATSAADIIYSGTTGQTVYVRIQTGASTYDSFQLTEGSSGGLGIYAVTDAALVSGGLTATTSVAAGYPNGYPYTVRTGTASDTANDTIKAVGQLPWGGTAETGAMSGTLDAQAKADVNAESDTAISDYAPSTAAALATAQTDLDTITGSDGVTLATTQGNYAPATATALSTAQMDLDTITGTAGAILDDDAITSNTIATDAITSAEASSSYIAEIQSGLATAAAQATAQSDLDTITGSNGVLVADNAINAAKLASNTLTSDELDTSFLSKFLTADTGETSAADGSVAKISQGASGLDAAGIRSALGMSSANLDTQISTAQTDLDTLTGPDGAILATTQSNYAPSTATAVATAQADLDTITGSDGVTLATTQGNYAPSTAAALATAQSDLDLITGSDGATLASSQGNYAPATVAGLATAQSDLDILTGSDGVTLATTQGNYAPAVAGDSMAMTTAAQQAVADTIVTFDTGEVAAVAGSAADLSGGSATIVAQDVADALKLAPAVGSPAAGSAMDLLISAEGRVTTALPNAASGTGSGLSTADNVDAVSDVTVEITGAGPIEHTPIGPAFVEPVSRRADGTAAVRRPFRVRVGESPWVAVDFAPLLQGNQTLADMDAPTVTVDDGNVSITNYGVYGTLAKMQIEVASDAEDDATVDVTVSPVIGSDVTATASVELIP